MLGVVGGSGSGKSVLLRSIIGLNKPTDGMIRVFGEDIGELHGMDLRALQMRWGVLFQEGALFSSQTVAENIQVPLREYTHMSRRADGRDRGHEARDGGTSGGCGAANIPPSSPAA